MNISRKTIGWGALGVLAAAVAVFAIRDHESSASNGGGHGGPGGGMPPMEVSVATVSKHTVPVYLDYVGTTEAMRIVTLQAKVSGHLAEQVAKDGADVNEGDLLYRIDPRDYQAAVDQAVAALRRDAAARNYNQSRQARNAQLAKDGWVAKDALEQTGSALQQSDAVLAADEAAIRTARLRLSYTDIKAPFSGRLSRSLVHEGSFINAEAGTQLNTLVQLDPIRVTFGPSERDLIAINQSRRTGRDLPVEVTLSDANGEKFTGVLSFIDNAIDRKTGTIAAQATIANAQRTLLPGQYVKIRVLLDERPDALLVPKVAIGSGQMGKFVYVAGADGHVEQKFVTLGAEIGDAVVVEKGVAEGDAVITDNLQKIGPGAPVKAKAS
jgi:multidrug efflux system membrane fusion protein